MKLTELYNLLLEGKQDSINLLQKTFPHDDQLQKELLHLDQTPSKGDIPTIIKYYNQNKNIDLLKQYLFKYYNFKSRNINVKLDNDFLKFTETIDAIEYKQSQKFKKPKEEVSNDSEEHDTNKLIDTDELTIFKGDSQHKCIQYGYGYTFCISKKAGGNMYNNYRMSKSSTFCISKRVGGNMYNTYRMNKASTFYFIFFKKIPKTNDHHICVLDRKDQGWEWTFADNNTETTTWDEVIARYPILTQYQHLFINKPFDDAELEKIKIIQRLKTNQLLIEFNKLSYEDKADFVKSGVMLNDDIFKSLNAELRNEYINVGPNITPFQADNLKNNEMLRYKRQRDILIPQLLQDNIYIFNKLDLDNSIIQNKISTGKKDAAIQVEWFRQSPRSDLNLIGYFLLELPDLSDLNIVGDFKCSYNQLTSLKGAPNTVGRCFDCSSNQLTSLEGAPNTVGGDFYCSNNQLTNLKGAPDSVMDFRCSNNQLISLEGAPSKVGGEFSCHHNKLTSLNGAPKIVMDTFSCSKNQLTSLDGAPDNVEGDFNCHSNKLTSLKGAPNIVEGDFICMYNELTSLKYAPKKVGRHFACNNNKLTSLTNLKGAPITIDGNFHCEENILTSLEGAPSYVGEEFSCLMNPTFFSASQIAKAQAETGTNIKMESFKTFYKTTILLEMPEAMGEKNFRKDINRIQEVDDLIGDDPLPDPVDFFVVNNIPINVFELFKPKNGFHEYVFKRADNDKTIAVYDGTEYKGGIETAFVQTAKGEYKGSLMTLIYKKFLLERYKFVISDDKLSSHGFNFWYRNYDNFKRDGYTFSIWDMRDSVEYPLKNKDELQEYMNHPNYRFKITR